MACNGICSRYGRRTPNGASYSDGWKYCSKCGVRFYIDSIWCPCCHYKMRTKSRNPKIKAKYEELGLCKYL